MPIKELNVDLAKVASSIEIVGRPEVLSRVVEGNWATSFKGRGLEFTGYRQYTFSDDASTIDWKATLRSKETLLREFEEFKNFKVLFVIDTSDNMLFTSSFEKFKAEYAAEILFILSQGAARAGDAIGLVMFNNGLVSSLQPSFGKGMRAMFERELLNKNNYGGPRDFKKSLLQIHSLLEDPAIILIFSDFTGLSNDWERYVSLLSARHQVYGIIVRDERDKKLPSGDGQFFLKDPESGASMYVDNKTFSKEYEKISSENIERVQNVFRKLRGDSVILENGTDPTKLLQKFFNRQKHLIG